MEKWWKCELAAKEKDFEKATHYLMMCRFLYFLRALELDFNGKSEIRNPELLITREFSQAQEIQQAEIGVMSGLRAFLIAKLTASNFEILEISEENEISEQTEELVNKSNPKEKLFSRWFYVNFCDNEPEPKIIFQIYSYFDCLEKNIIITFTAVVGTDIFSVNLEQVKVGERMYSQLKDILNRCLDEAMEVARKERANYLVEIMAKKLEEENFLVEAFLPYNGLNSSQEEKRFTTGINFSKNGLFFNLVAFTNLRDGQIEIRCSYLDQNTQKIEETVCQRKFANLQEIQGNLTQLIDKIVKKIKGLEDEL